MLSAVSPAGAGMNLNRKISANEITCIINLTLIFLTVVCLLAVFAVVCILVYLTGTCD